MILSTIVPNVCIQFEFCIFVFSATDLQEYSLLWAQLLERATDVDHLRQVPKKENKKSKYKCYEN